jgi:hypothetical protein
MTQFAHVQIDAHVLEFRLVQLERALGLRED